MTIDQLRQQRAAGFRWLRFQPQLEPHYRTISDQGIQERARPVCAAAFVLFLLYAVLDWLMLPATIADDTIAIRLLITCPAIAVAWWLSWRPINPTVYVWLYGLAYLIGGLSVVAIIAVARLAGYPLPYEGILLMLMFGYFVMGLPFRMISVLSLIIVAAFTVVEVKSGTPSREIMINGFFILTANIVGMVGSWLSERRQRAHFLDRQMLEALRQKAEQESERKTSLITIAGHDLRQPLNIISLILENLTADGLPKEQEELVSRLRTSVTHFNSLLASVLDISRLQEGMVKPEPEPLLPARVMTQLEDTCLERAQSLGITVRFHDNSGKARVMADPQLLHRVLQNLVFNAMDHSGGTQIDVSADRENEHLVFRVHDNGKGIDATTRTRIFDPFFRSSDNSDPGLGLGLAIVRELSELMDGQCLLEADADADTGACFSVFMPALDSDSLPEEEIAPVTSDSRYQQGLIVVEDHDESRQWVHRTLQNWGYTVRSFQSAEQAMAQEEVLSDAILITDLHLPSLSGDHLFRELTDRRVVTGGILVTADTSRAEGFNPARRLWTLHKPLQPMRLRAALQRLIRAG